MIQALWLPPDVIAKSFPIIWPHLERFCNRFPTDYSLREVQIGLLTGVNQGFMAWDEETKTSHAFAFGSIVDDYDGSKSLLMRGIEGDHLGDWQGLMEDEFSRFAKANNCKRIRFTGRKGWAKKLSSWKIAFYVFERAV